MSSKKITFTYSRFLKISIQIFGILVTIIALIFAIKKTLIIGQSNWDKLLNVRVLLITVFGGVAYGLDSIFLAWAWQKLLIWFGEPAKLKLCIAIYGRSQIAKYIPGNFFQLPSRHVMGAQVGFNHPAQIGAAIYEIIGLIASAGMIASIGFSIETYFGNSIALALKVIILFILIFLTSQFFMSYFNIGRKLGFPNRSISDGMKHFLPVWAFYLVFFVLAGVIFWGIVGTTTGLWLDVPIQSLVSIFAISWLTGFLTPGAPAGIGVREATIILILSGFIGEPSAVLVAIISRLIVTVGDLVFWAFSNFLSVRDLR
jgi:uncharacterized membrane protein YbhN (UPF0104 family)